MFFHVSVCMRKNKPRRIHTRRRMKYRKDIRAARISSQFPASVLIRGEVLQSTSHSEKVDELKSQKLESDWKSEVEGENGGRIPTTIFHLLFQDSLPPWTLVGKTSINPKFLCSCHWSVGMFGVLYSYACDCLLTRSQLHDKSLSCCFTLLCQPIVSPQPSFPKCEHILGGEPVQLGS